MHRDAGIYPQGRVTYMNISPATLDISAHSAMLAQERLETIKCKGLTDCSLEADSLRD